MATIIAFVVYAVAELRTAEEPIDTVRRASYAALFGGLSAASLIEIVKRATSFRGAFQRRALLAHFGDVVATSLRQQLRTFSGKRSDRKRGHVATDLPTMARSALYYSAPTNQLSGQLSELADRAMADPSNRLDLLVALAGVHESEVKKYVDTYIAAAKQWSRPDAETAQVSETEGLAPDAKQSSRPDAETAQVSDIEGFDPVVQRLTEQGAELHSVIEGRIEGFQVTVEAQWRLAMRLAACALSAISAALITEGIDLERPGMWVAIAAGLTIGTVAAWVTNDLLAIVRRFSE